MSLIISVVLRWTTPP